MTSPVDNAHDGHILDQQCRGHAGNGQAYVHGDRYYVYRADMDCAGTVNGNAVFDSCGVCGGAGAAKDDCGVCNGNNADKDDCGVCFGSNDTGCTSTPTSLPVPAPTAADVAEVTIDLELQASVPLTDELKLELKGALEAVTGNTFKNFEVTSSSSSGRRRRALLSETWYVSITVAESMKDIAVSTPSQLAQSMHVSIQNGVGDLVSSLFFVESVDVSSISAEVSPLRDSYDGPTGGICFAGDSTVLLQDGTTKTMRELKVS